MDFTSNIPAKNTINACFRSFICSPSLDQMERYNVRKCKNENEKWLRFGFSVSSLPCFVRYYSLQLFIL